ncbi:MAG: hypothetical protein ACTJHU_02245 [Mycetocola sp.]
MAEEKKKVVRVPSSQSATPTGDAAQDGQQTRRSRAGRPAASSSSGTSRTEGSSPAPGWTPTPEAAASARTRRIIALVLWALAIAAEAVAIFWLLKQPTINTLLLIGFIVLIGALSIIGSLLWKQANRLDPASREDRVRFFVQNQLGAIIAVVAFLPLIVLIFTNKNLDGKQKGVVGGIGIAVLLVAGYIGASLNPPSVEQYTEESNIVSQLTGEDLVFWTKSGSVFHVCEDVPDVNRQSQDGQIYTGTVADAHANGKERLTLRWQSEAINYCGYTQEQVDAVVAGTSGTTPSDQTEDGDGTDSEPTEG